CLHQPKGTRMEPEIYYAIGGTAAAMIGLYLIFRYVQVGGDFAKHRQANDIAQRWLTDAKFQDAVAKALTPPPPPPPPKPSAEPLLLLTLMQRDGRLIDFLLENVDAADNE